MAHLSALRRSCLADTVRLVAGSARGPSLACEVCLAEQPDKNAANLRGANVERLGQRPDGILEDRPTSCASSGVNRKKLDDLGSVWTCDHVSVRIETLPAGLKVSVECIDPPESAADLGDRDEESLVVVIGPS